MHIASSDSVFLEALYNENYTFVYRLVIYAMHQYRLSTADAADLTQDVFITAATKIDQLQTHPNPKGWLAKTTYNTCNNYIHARIRHNEQLFATLDLHRSDDDTIAALDTMISLEQTLSPEDYSLIKAYYIEKRPTEEICKEAGISPNLLRVRIHRLKKYLSTFFVLLVIFASTHNI